MYMNTAKLFCTLLISSDIASLPEIFVKMIFQNNYVKKMICYIFFIRYKYEFKSLCSENSFLQEVYIENYS